MRQYISPALRRRVSAASRYRCGYCLTPQSIIGPLLVTDHIIPQARGGTSDEENLILACPLCNSYKVAHIEVVDPETRQIVPLFNPRQDVWTVHFQWVEEGTIIQGKTVKGRATIKALNMNHPDVVQARQLWVNAGWHPPADSLSSGDL